MFSPFLRSCVCPAGAAALLRSCTDKLTLAQFELSSRDYASLASALRASPVAPRAIHVHDLSCEPDDTNEPADFVVTQMDADVLLGALASDLPKL